MRHLDLADVLTRGPRVGDLALELADALDQPSAETDALWHLPHLVLQRRAATVDDKHLPVGDTFHNGDYLYALLYQKRPPSATMNHHGRARREPRLSSGALGDFITTLPALHAWRRIHPGDRVVLIGVPAFATLAEAGLLDETWDVRSRLLASLFAPEIRSRPCRTATILIVGTKKAAQEAVGKSIERT